MRISDWSSDVCSSDLTGRTARRRRAAPAWRVRVAGSWIGHRNPWRGGLLARKHAFGTEVAAEGAALADLALDLQPRLVQLQDVLDDRQAQAGAAGLARAAGGHAVEAFGDPRQVRGGDAVAAVAHRKDRAAIGAARKDDRDIAAGRRVAHRVRSEEHTSETQSLMRISYAVFCWKTKNN